MFFLAFALFDYGPFWFTAAFVASIALFILAGRREPRDDIDPLRDRERL